jgi:gliding motility-associated-like protein
MQDIEKLARSVFENAEQEPPREVWDNIEAKLYAPAAQPAVPRHRGIVAAVAGTVVVGAVVAVIMLNNNPKPIEQLAFVDSIPEVVVADEQVVERVAAQKEGPSSAAVKPVGKNETSVRTTSESHHSTVASSNQEEDEAYFDLLEYQLRSHEYDIPSDEKSTAVSKRDNSAQSSSSPKEESRPASAKKSSEIEIVIPNLLSPNGDGYNDCWKIPNLAQYGKASVQIFSEQNKRVFSSDDYKGDFCGDDLPSGNYFYVLSLKDHNYTRRGILVIKR